MFLFPFLYDNDNLHYLAKKRDNLRIHNRGDGEILAFFRFNPVARDGPATGPFGFGLINALGDFPPTLCRVGVFGDLPNKFG